jgi:mannose-6-phosphate isomerase
VRTDRYAGKVLFIKAGSQLSLQYHEKKDEAFFVQAGSLELVLGRGPDQTVVRMGPGDSRHITPGTVHRFRAVTDTLLFEVSTSELEDVVRIEDDYGREGLKDAL